MKIIKLILICCGILLTKDVLAAARVCCSSDMTPKQCCESQSGAWWTWCAQKGKCVANSNYCDYICSDHTRSDNCGCAGPTIYVSSPKASAQPYCCGSNETFQACCQALGFTWVGPTANTGKCSAPDPDVCVDYVEIYEATKLCCDGEDMTETDCCASMYGQWCPSTHKCYSQSSRDYYDYCPDVTEEECVNAYYEWCTSPERCFTDHYRYLDECDDVQKCMQNSDCTGNGEFCWFGNYSDCSASLQGECKEVESFARESKTASDGNIWIISRSTMNWWSSRNWCSAQGLKPVTRSDIGCADVLGTVNHMRCSSNTYKALTNVLSGNYGMYFWLEDYGNGCYAWNAEAYKNGNTVNGYKRHSGEYTVCKP